MPPTLVECQHPLSFLPLRVFRCFGFLLYSPRKTGGALVVLGGLRCRDVVIHLCHSSWARFVVRVFHVTT